MIRIGIDISSGEKPPLELFLSLKDYLKDPNSEGDFLKVYVHKDSCKKDPDQFIAEERLEIIQVSQSIEMDDSPLKAVRRKKDSSIVKGLEALKNGEIDFFFSPGNTGSLISGAHYIIGMIGGIHFPAVAVLIPNIFGDVLLLDAGASFLIDEERGMELAIMGKVLYESLYEEKNPLVGVLNIGKEWHKGPKWVRKLDTQLQRDKDFNYFGYVEGFDLMTSPCRVFISGGYTGNILLKGLEGIYYLLKEGLKGKEQLMDELKVDLHYSRSGAGIVLGTKNNLFLGHGITGAKALKNALFFAKKIYKLNITAQIESEIRKKGFLAKILKRR